MAGRGGRGAGGGDSGGGSGGEASGTGGAGGDATIDLTCEAGDETGLVVVVPEHLQEGLAELPEGGEITPGRYALAAVEVYDPLGEEPFPIEPTRALWELARDEARQSFDTFDEQGLPTFGYVLASYATAGTVMTNLLTCATMSFEPGTEAAFEYTARDDAFLTFVRPVEGADLVVLRRYVRQ